MDDAHEVLGLPLDATEEAIRRRYLELVRQYSPERDPQRFAAIRAAYESLRDPVARMHTRLFDLAADGTVERVEAEIRNRLREARLPVEALLSLAKRS
jgi:curved DNA-binding protein CbpA